MKSVIVDHSLAEAGTRRIDWARTNMPIVVGLADEFRQSRPFENLRIGICLHVEAKTGVWIEALVAGGAEVFITGSPGSTQDDTAAALADMDNVHVFARSDETFDDHLLHCEYVLQSSPDLIADNGADLHHLIYSRDSYRHLGEALIGATEETTTGTTRLRESIKCRDFPTLSINDTLTKRIVENRFGVGSSVIDGLMRATNVMLHGKNVVVIGYGYCGAGVAQRLRGMGAHVTVAERDPLTLLEAHLEGFRTSALEECVSAAQIVITVTGYDDILKREHFEMMRTGVIVANAGHFASEIDVPALEDLSVSKREIRDEITEYSLPGERKLFLVSEGNLVNLSAGDGNPIEIMDLGLALQSLSLRYLARDAESLQNGVQPVPRDVERFVAERAVAHWIK
ncbi:MAG: adenosylhomocysteinase [Gammaproteobacteria bacterium]|nr:adenosylhomocysteinase [Gammaproteobacteria bacterium]